MITGLTKQSVEAIAAHNPGWLAAQRQTAWQTFDNLPLPTRRDVDWQHFDIRPLKLDKLNIGTENQPNVTSHLAGNPAGNGVIFCDLATAIAKHGDLVKEYFGKSVPADEPNKFAALSAACWQAGTFLYVPANVRIEGPLEIRYELHGQSAAAFPRTLVVIEPGAEATLLQKFVGGPAAGSNGVPSLHASATEVFVKEGGHLHYISQQNLSPHVFDFTIKRAHVAKDAEIDWVIGMFGASFQRYDIECIMEGQGSTSYMYGVGFGERNQQLGQFTRQHHKTGNTLSDLLFKNVLRDSAVSNYTGVIKVEKNANGTNAYQSNRNLVLSDKVQCDTRPILEIESNQLRCTHGATVGRLEEQQLFYLRSRGLTLEQSRQILIEAFLDPVLARIQVKKVYQEFSDLIHSKVVR